jgi:predicted transcriptional regulator
MDPIPVRLPHDLQDRVDAISKELSISRSAVLRLAIQQWLDAAEVRGLNPILRDHEPSLVVRDEKSTPRPSKSKKSGPSEDEGEI